MSKALMMSALIIKNPSKVYIGNISRSADENEIDQMFRGIGKLLSLEFKGDFAFAEYKDAQSAEDAIRRYDGARVRGRRLIVEPFRYRGGDPRYRRRPPPKHVKRGEYRCIITNLAAKTTADDLRDWLKHEKLKSVTITDVYNRHGMSEGVVEFRDKDDWKFCLKKLDHVKLDGVYIGVIDEKEYNRRKLKEQGPMRQRMGRDNFVMRGRERSRSRSRGRRMLRRRVKDAGDITAGSMPGYRDDRGAGGSKRRQRYRSNSRERMRNHTFDRHRRW